MSEATGLKRILVLDDDADFRALLRNHLGKMFDRVELQEYDPVARGVPGDDFDWSRYDVLILDYYLCIHNVTGLDILQANRKNKFFPATIMLTGAGSEEVAVRAVKAGVYDYLRKEKLDKEQLKKSILNAFEEHKEEQQRLSELTNQNLAFNKALFYQKLETPDDEGGKDRVLLLIELDDAGTLEERVGVILRDNIVRHMAHRSFEVFQVGECHPHITRLGDTAVAILIDKPASAKTLAFNMDGLCTHLKKRPYKFDDKKFRFTVSIGVVEVPRTGRSADRLIQQARHSVEVASRTAGRSSFHVFKPDDDLIPVQTSEAVPVAEAPAMVDEPPTDRVQASAAGIEKPARPARTVPETDAAPTAAAAPASTAAPPDSPSPDAPAIATAPLPSKTGNDSAGSQALPRAPEARPGLSLEPVAPQPEPPIETSAETPATVKPDAGPVAPPVAADTTPRVATSPPRQVPAVTPVAGTPAPPGAKRPSAESPRADAPKPAAPGQEPPRAPAVAATAPPTAKTTAGTAAPAKTAPAKQAADEIDLDETTLGENARKVKQAFSEKRIVQTFQPIMPLYSEEGVDAPEAYRVHLQFIDRDGSIKTEEFIYAEASTPEFQKFIDRWLLRETIGRVVNNPKSERLFVIRISEASLADPGLFNWLRKMLGGLEKQRPGKSIALEMTASEFANQRKKAGALVAYLGKSQGFRFVLAELGQPDEARTLVVGEPQGIDLLKVGHEMLQKLKTTPASAGTTGSLFDGLAGKGIHIIADDIQDATTLTNVIGVGAHFAMGNFIGEPTQHIDDSTNVETFEIT